MPASSLMYQCLLHHSYFKVDSITIDSSLHHLCISACSIAKVSKLAPVLMILLAPMLNALMLTHFITQCLIHYSHPLYVNIVACSTLMCPDPLLTACSTSNTAQSRLVSRQVHEYPGMQAAGSRSRQQRQGTASRT